LLRAEEVFADIVIKCKYILELIAESLEAIVEEEY
jgi:hypothetical protein